ncbi:MAG: LPS-assembly protein LptD [Gammaproteobacteria bacterium]
MSSPKQPIGALVILLVSAGVLLGNSPKAQAQLPSYNCQASSDGSGWECTTNNERGARQARSSVASQSASIDAPSSPTPEAANFPLDWVPREAMTEEQREALDRACCGGFIDPLADQPVATDNEAGATQFNSATGLNQVSRDEIQINGDVRLQQSGMLISNNNETTINRADNTVQLNGDVQVREPGLLLQGETASIDGDAQINRIGNAQYVMHEFGAHGNAGSIVYNGESGQITIENGEFSRCEPQEEFWRLRAASIILDPDQSRGYARDVSLRIGEVPVFYYPFTMTFPLGDGRVSGFLAPSLGTTRTGGVDIEVPYYFNIAPQADATVAPRLISDRGVMTSAELRYLASWSMNTLNASFLPDDDLFDPAQANTLGSDSPPVADRWYLGYEHFGALSQNWSTYVDYNAVSDSDYFYDLGGNGLNVASQSHLNRQARLQFSSSLLRAGVNVQRFQIIDPFFNTDTINKPFDRLPQFYFDSDQYLGAGFSVELDGQVTSFDRQLDRNLISDAQVAAGALVNGERVNLEPALKWAVETPGWFLRTSATYKHLAYDLDQQANSTQTDPEIGVPVYSVDSGLVFERERNGRGLQTLEPRVFYLQSDYQQQDHLPLFDTSELNFSFKQLFREDRFAGGDRIADADQATFALTTRLFSERGEERARFSLGQIFYFADRRVTLTNPLQTWQPRYSGTSEESALAGEMALSLGDNWRLNSDVQWDQQAEEINEGSMQLRYHGGDEQIFNLSYRYRRLVNSPNFTLPAGIDPRIKQTDLSAVWPLNENWTILGRWNYDHSNERNLESFAGLEWNNCCATIRVVAREWVDENELFVPNSEPNQGIFVQFTLHGLGDLAGGGLSNLLRDGIWGFRDTSSDSDY